MAKSCAALLGLRLTVASLAEAASARIFVYDLPECSFDHYPAEAIDGPVWGLHDGRPPLLPIHREITASRFVTADPAEASLFYIPAPFFLWDNSWGLMERKTACPEPAYSREERQVFDGRTLFPLPAAVGGNSSKSANAWTVSMWARMDVSHAEGLSVLLSAETMTLGFADGCPVLSATCCGALRAENCGRRPESSWADGDWHVLAVVYNRGVLRFYVDSVPIGEAAAELESDAVWATYGGTPHPGINKSNFTGEAKDLRVYRTAVLQDKVMRCISATWRQDNTGFDMPQAITASSRCFRSVREHVEAQPWLRRRGGWDHFVLFAGADYPSAFNPIHPPEDEHFVLEIAWPAFAHFSVLTFGARVERCFAFYAQFPGDFADGARAQPGCVRRLFRSITIPPILEGESFSCEQLNSLLQQSRPTRVGYRGVAYSAMPERNAFHSLRGEFWTDSLQDTREARLEFTNFTHERVEAGYCSAASAFEGLCPWSLVGRDPREGFGKRRAKAMKQFSLGLWAKSDTCLVLPGDGGFELRLYSMINLGCIPVIVHLAGTNFPKIPFANLLPWNDFAIFWALGKSGYEDEDISHAAMVLHSAHALLLQLAALGSATLARKRKALLLHAPKLRWGETGSCSGGKPAADGPNTLDLIVDELMHRAALPEDPGTWARADWARKVPAWAVMASMMEDVTGNNCPLGFFMCSSARKTSEPHRGDVCHSATVNMGLHCPLGCRRLDGGDLGPRCVGWNNTARCRNPLCSVPIRMPKAFAFVFHSQEIARASFGDSSSASGWVQQASKRYTSDWEPRIALITSGARPDFAEVTRPSIERFLAAHPGRYDALLGEPRLLDPRDYEQAWEKWALLRRTMLMGSYDALVWLDDDVLITQPEADPIWDEAMVHFFSQGSEVQVVLPLLPPGETRVPYGTGMVILRTGVKAARIVEALFKIANTRSLWNGVQTLPRQEGDLDEDAVAMYVDRHGSDSFGGSQHGVLLSGIEPNGLWWGPEHFAARIDSKHGDQWAFKVIRSLGRQLGVAKPL